MKLGLVGFGRMGAAMAQRLTDMGCSLSIWNRSPVRPEALPPGATIAQTLGDLVAASDVVLSCLFDEAAVRAVYLGKGGLADHASSAKLFIDASTVPPAIATDIAKAVAPVGGRFVDAPVLGTTAPARQGHLVALLGGERHDVEVAHDVMRFLASTVHVMGGTGAGYASKLAITLVKGSYWAALGECFVLAGRHGIAPGKVLDVIEGGPGALTDLPIKLPVLRGTSTEVGFSIAGVAKDLREMVVAGGGEERMPVTAGALKHSLEAIDGGWAERDVAALALFAAERVRG